MSGVIQEPLNPGQREGISYDCVLALVFYHISTKARLVAGNGLYRSKKSELEFGQYSCKGPYSETCEAVVHLQQYYNIC